MLIDWSRWGALTEELRDSEGHYACFVAWEQIMAEYAQRGADGGEWWDALDIYQRCNLFGAMVELSVQERDPARVRRVDDISTRRGA